MTRKRLTEVFPALLPLRIRQKEFVYYTKMKTDSNTYTSLKGEYLSEEVASIRKDIINENSGFDIKYQFNKLHNLNLLKDALDGLFILPNEVFSFNLTLRQSVDPKQFKEGLIVVNGKMESSLGGGICQMSNNLYEAVLMSPLTVLERHAHASDYFSHHPDDILGLDATVHSGWLDLKIKNNTKELYQFKVNIIDSILCISILSKQAHDYSITLRNEDVNIFKENNINYQSYKLFRDIYQDDIFIKSELICNDKIKLMYPIKEINNEEN